MTWLQGMSMFGAVPLYCGDRSTIPQGNSEGTGRKHDGSQTVYQPSYEKHLSRTKREGKSVENQRESHTYISKGDLQSTVRLTWWPLMVKTRVCHWLSARWVSWNPHFVTTPSWPLKRKCRRFLESLSPRMSRPCSSLLLTNFASVSPGCSVFVSFSSSLSLNPCLPTLFTSIKVKMYSCLWKDKQG